MDSHQEDYIKGLYIQFHDESKNGNPSAESYSVEELLDIFDYASDMGDNYTQLMVLLKSQVEYPDNPELQGRRAIFLTFSTGGTILTQDFSDRNDDKSALWRIMRMYNGRPDSDTVRRELDEILHSPEQLDDETVIRLVDLLFDLDMLDWLIDNLDVLKTKVQYLETLLHEAAQECISHERTEHAIVLLSELTDIEPFDPLYWRMLASQYVVVDSFKDALKAVDYALAIDGKDIATQMLKAQIVFDLYSDHGDAVNIMERLYRKNPQESGVAFLLAQMLTLVGRTDESRQIILKFLQNNPADQQMIQSAMLLHDDDLTHRVLQKYISCENSLDDDVIERFSDHLVDVQCSRESVLLQYLWYRIHPDTKLYSRIVTGLYLLGQYEDVCRMIYSTYGEFPVVKFGKLDFTEWVMALLASARCNKTNAVLSLSASMVSMHSGQFPPSMRLAVTTAKAIAETISNLQDRNPEGIRSEDIDALDPFRTI